MPVEIRLPQYGMGMQEGTVVAWRKKEGDAVGAGEVIAEIEAAKTTEELTAPEAGVLTRIVVPEGATVPVRGLLAVLTSPTEPATEPPTEPAGEPDPNVAQVTPRARRLARETGVDLARVAGTGPGGRITEEDVRAAAAAGGPALTRRRPPNGRRCGPPSPGACTRACTAWRS